MFIAIVYTLLFFFQKLHQHPYFEYNHMFDKYSKTCVKRPLKIDNTKILMTNCSLMKVECIAECSLWSILQYFWPALNDNWSWKQFVVFFRVAVLQRFYCTAIWS